MFKSKKYFSVFTGCLLFMFVGINPSFCVEEVMSSNENEITTNTTVENKVYSQNIKFNDVMAKAVEHSYDLKIADFNILSVSQDIRGARSEYFPKIYFGASTEYNKNFQDNVQTPTTYVGDTFINPYTRYQSVLGFTLAYNLFDFGVRKGNLDIAKEDTETQKLLQKQQLQELKLNITDIYTRLCSLTKQVEYTNKIIELSKKNLEMSQRLFKAKELSKSELNDQIAEVKKYEFQLNDILASYEEYLTLLSFYTNDLYSPQNVKISEIPQPSFNPFEFEDYEKTLVFDIYEKILNKKKLELKVAKRNYLPKLNLYSRYYLYGSDVRSYIDTNKDIEPSNWSIGASLNMPVFDGMKNSSMVKKAYYEYEKAFVEKEKALAELKKRVSTMRSNLYYVEKQIDNSEVIVSELSEKDENTKKLLSKRLVSPIEANIATIELLKEQMELEKNKTLRTALLKGIEELTTYNKD